MAWINRMEDLLLAVLRDRPARVITVAVIEATAKALLVLELFWLLQAPDLMAPKSTCARCRRAGAASYASRLRQSLSASSRFTMPAARAIWWSTRPTSSSRCCKRHRACPYRSFGSTASIL